MKRMINEEALRIDVSLRYRRSSLLHAVSSLAHLQCKGAENIHDNIEGEDIRDTQGEAQNHGEDSEPDCSHVSSGPAQSSKVTQFGSRILRVRCKSSGWFSRLPECAMQGQVEQEVGELTIARRYL